MKRSHKQLAFVVVLLLTLIPIFFMVQKPAYQDNNQIIPMKAPGFVTEAQAGNSNIGTLLDNEAGISAYFESATPIDLNQVRGEFRTIEQETADYIIGSVPVPNYVEQYDVHVYVHKDGWILAYYLKTDPAAKIVDVRGHTVTTTKLKTIVQIMAVTAGVPFTDVTYYDFRHPNATNLIIIAEDWQNGHEFTVTLPPDFSYFERSWSVYDTYPDYIFILDGLDLRNQATWEGFNTFYGSITTSSLLPDVLHTIRVDDNDDAFGALVIIYRGQ